MERLFQQDAATVLRHQHRSAFRPYGTLVVYAAKFRFSLQAVIRWSTTARTQTASVRTFPRDGGLRFRLTYSPRYHSVTPDCDTRDLR